MTISEVLLALCFGGFESLFLFFTLQCVVERNFSDSHHHVIVSNRVFDVFVDWKLGGFMSLLLVSCVYVSWAVVNNFLVVLPFGTTPLADPYQFGSTAAPLRSCIYPRFVVGFSIFRLRFFNRMDDAGVQYYLPGGAFFR